MAIRKYGLLPLENTDTQAAEPWLIYWVVSSQAELESIPAELIQVGYLANVLGDAKLQIWNGTKWK